MKALGALLFIFSISGCASIYYDFWETFGKEKRDLLEIKMQAVKGSQGEVKEEFKDSLERLRKTYNLKSEGLASVYDDISNDYEEAVEKSDEYKKNISEANEIAEDLFTEWKSEAKEIENRAYRNASLKKLKLTKVTFRESKLAIDRSVASLDKVLRQYKDQVLFIKHNLNAKMIGKLEVELVKIEGNVKKLIFDLESSSEKTEKFISRL